MSLFNKIKSVFNSSSDDVPDAQTIYFKNGEMYKVYPTDKESWYDARYLVSDGVKYDLENLDDLKRIPVPKFPAHQNIMDGYGVTGKLDYVLRMKAGSCYNRKDKIRCSACLWKCTELMFAHPFLSWDESHFYRIVQWHVEMGMFDEADEAEKYIYSSSGVMCYCSFLLYRFQIRQVFHRLKTFLAVFIYFLIVFPFHDSHINFMQDNILH